MLYKNIIHESSPREFDSNTFDSTTWHSLEQQYKILSQGLLYASHSS